MSNTVIKVEDLGKKYFLRHQKQKRYTALRDVIANKIKSLGKKVFNPASHELTTLNSSVEEFWALKDISLEINQGERLGIIGRNGAGKTTLLKILSRITEPTTGRVSIKGRVASLLEVGTGFHPELTGRENVYLNGAILGMTKAEIKRKFDEIVTFAEVEKFLDTPVKRYSSGMYVRLAFAVAAHLEPEILIVDEVLAVGDAQFQKKCLGKMEDVGKEGRTVLFVSHNLSAIQRLCEKGICLETGNIKAMGAIPGVLNAYQNDFNYEVETDQNIEVRDGEVRIIKWQILNSSTGLPHSCYSRDNCEFLFSIVAKRRILNVYIGFALWDIEGKLILAASSLDNDGNYYSLDEGIYKAIIKVSLPLKAGNYQLDISLNSADIGQFDRWTSEPKLKILPRQNSSLPDKWHGLVNEEVHFKIEKN